MNATGGTPSFGGTSASGVTTSSGGTTKSGVTTSSGGATSSGATSSSGKSGSGGTTSSGGTSATGNGGSLASRSGGASAGGTGGAAPPSGGSLAGPGTRGTVSPGTGGSSAPASVLVTSAEGAYWKTASWTEVTSNATLVVSDGTTYQTWEGFGGAFNEKGWGTLSVLSQADRDQALSLLFGDDGARFNMGRVPIGANDYSIDRYTLDEVASSSDKSLASFSVSRDQQNLIPFIKAAMGVRSNLRFWASPWTPPPWMKSGPFQDSSSFDGGTMKSDDATLSAWPSRIRTAVWSR